MYPSIIAWVRENLNPSLVEGKDILEAGALDVNGSIRPTIEAMNPKTYLATDMMTGPGVDQVMEASELPPESADLVISLEMLEHAQNWQMAMIGMADAVRLNGYFLISTRRPGFFFHGHPNDYHRFTEELMSQILECAGMRVIICGQDSHPESELNGVCAIGQPITKPDYSALLSLEAFGI